MSSNNLEIQDLKAFKTGGYVKGAATSDSYSIPVWLSNTDSKALIDWRLIGIALAFARRRKAKVTIVAKGKNFFHLFQHGSVVAFAVGYARALERASEIERGVFHAKA